MKTYFLPALIFSLSGFCGTCQAAPTPVEHFFDQPEFSAAELSPDARFLALRAGEAGKYQGLAVIDLESGEIHPVVAFPDIDVGNFHWINSKRLVFDARHMRKADLDLGHAPGLFAVDRDGTHFKQLAQRVGEGIVTQDHSKRNPNILSWNHFLIPQPGSLTSDHVYVLSPHYTGIDAPKHVGLKRVDTYSGLARLVSAPDNTQDWVIDHQGEPRIAISEEKDQTVVSYRDSATSAWRKLASFNSFTGGFDGFTPLAFGPNGTLYVTANAGKDKTSLHVLDLATGKVKPEAKIEVPDYDFNGKLLISNGKLAGVRLTAETETTTWFDPAMQAAQRAVDALLPNTVNLLSVAVRPETPWLLVEAYSDKVPRTFLIYNATTGALRKIGSSRPRIEPAQMAQQQTLRYKARDGLDIPAVLTLPPGVPAKNLPLVVLVHGGPYVRGTEWGWSAESQFLASRGYAVLEPEYRGSTGYGFRHFKAGWKQWGLRMQDDVADGAKWAIAQGIADGKRVCIAGASYGGYATLMGLVNDPDLYRCGINWVGVTDIGLMYNGTWYHDSDISSRFRQYGMPDLVGDREKDAAQLAATSPLLQAARIKQPLLLAYGGADQRVPIYHGRKFYDAVKKHNSGVEWIEYTEEGHGWRAPKNEIDFWRKVEKFLERSIGPGALN
jgi:dipeptidyl aminopeptidase/acylaminoacyl peptidase